MRDILFRGKSIIGNFFVTGSYYKSCDLYGNVCHEILLQLGNKYIVAPETVGQYTGLTDKNGTKIFEGDIVRGIAYSSEWIGVIVWIDKIASFGLRHGHDIAWENCTILKRAAKGMHDEFTAEVIGNIYDNPELLEEAEND